MPPAGTFEELEPPWVETDGLYKQYGQNSSWKLAGERELCLKHTRRSDWDSLTEPIIKEKDKTKEASRPKVKIVDKRIRAQVKPDDYK